MIRIGTPVNKNCGAPLNSSFMQEHQSGCQQSAGRLQLVDPTDMPANVSILVALIPESPIHRAWKADDIARLFIPPLSLGQCFGFTRQGRPWGIFTWMRLTEAAERGYLARTRKLQPGDWAAGDRFWMADAIAPYGLLANMAGMMRRELSRKADEQGWAVTEGRWARTFGTGIVKHIGAMKRCG